MVEQKKAKRRGRWPWIVLGLFVLLVAALATWVWRNPLALHERTTRRALRGSGFVAVELQSAGEPLTVWQGGEGPPLVFLHGAGDQAGAWAVVASGFVGEHRVLVPDLPGHGESGPAAGPLPMQAVYGGLETFLLSLEEEPVLVGNSLGAWVAMVYAHRHPGRVKRIVAVNGGPLRGEREDLSLTPGSREEARRLMEELRDPSSPRVPDFVLDDIVEHAVRGPIGRLARDAQGMEAFLLDGRLAELETPVDLLWGESDRLLPPSYAERMARELPRARLTLVPQCGHVPPNECPHRLGELLKEILAQPPPSEKTAAAVDVTAEPGAAPGDSGDPR